VFDSPIAIYGLLAVAAAGVLYFLARIRERRKTRKLYGDFAAASREGFLWKRDLPVILFLGAVAFLVLALAQFRLDREAIKPTVLLVLDTSASMNQTDVSPNRLDAATTAARAFIDQVPVDFRVGLVTFNTEADVVVPPVEDHATVGAALDDLPRGQATVIGDGLSAALDTIQTDPSQGKQPPSAVLLLSDGRDTGSQVPPQQAAERAKAMGVRVFTVVLGKANSEGGGGANAVLLQQIADTTGAQAFSAETAGQLTQIYESLGTQLSTELTIGGGGALFVALGAIFAIAAAVMLLVGARSKY
jgi:Ca-activated chloride channel family protein